jgi:hypothetical protein
MFYNDPLFVKIMFNSFCPGIAHSLLRQANHSIVTYGSFGMWGAMLNEGIIVAPESHRNYNKWMEKHPNVVWV